MTIWAIWTGAGEAENNCAALTLDADYVYAGIDYFPAKVMKIDSRRRRPLFWEQ